ncbi:hypothetical protein J4771_02385 [Candidatus Kaistella beijingensis]|uniref:hypothetical protein n=1 Tax=Candidatus Kaistella beijingensis TaxID=2820270 RepID=UPI001CC542A7|nr:hypothetical protein [Candidatus Kaistella beijingensis]UBB90224.1 hypothetical protein J4771_02385 [Candidatus Kaistella beijingensis]
MKILSITLILAASFAFGQKTTSDKDIQEILSEINQSTKTQQSIKNGSYQDLTKNEAFTRFQKSNVRERLGIQIREFNYELFSMFAKEFKVPLSKMAVFNSVNEKALDELKTAYLGANNPILCKECYYLPFKAQISK